MLLTILTIIGNLLPISLPKVGVSVSLDGLISAALSASITLIAGIKTGTAVDASLTALETALAAVQADTSLEPTVLSDIAEGIRDLQAAIAAYKAAEVTTDPSTLTPLPTM